MSSLISKGYTPCEYIESSGTQYIDTGFIPNQDTRVVIECEFQIMGTNVYLYGAQESASSKTFGFRAYNTYYRTHYDNGSTGYSASVSYTGKFEIDQNKNVTTLQGEHAVSRTYNSFECPNSLTLCGANQGGTIIGKSICKIYSCKIYDNGSLIRDYKPCRNTSGVYGLFDEVNDVFYTTPSGSFTGNVAETSIKLSQSFRRRMLISSIKVEVDYEKQYLTIESLNSGNISLTGGTIYYSKNGGAWVSGTNGASVTVVSGDKVRFKATRTTGGLKFRGTAKFNVYGNIMSLIHGDDFVGNNTLFNHAFEVLFSDSLVVDASNLILPATRVPENGYFYMFDNCTSLTKAPELPATTLADSCYVGMFYNCTRLTTAPELPATTLADSCYVGMFYNCTSLTTAPELPATTLADYCYTYMFEGCTSLNHITMLATDISAYDCLFNWVYNVSSSGTFVKHPNMDSLPTGESGIPYGWTVV